MNLEHVSVGKSSYTPTSFRSKAIQLPLFPKQALRPDYRVSSARIERTLRDISARGLCGKVQVKAYLHRQLRHNCRPNTIRSSSSTIVLFLEFYKHSGQTDLSAIKRKHISDFVEHEQDRGMAPVSVDVRLKTLYAFLNFLVDQDLIGIDVLKRKLRNSSIAPYVQVLARIEGETEKSILEFYSF